VRSADDVRALKSILAERGAKTPVLAKIEKPEAVADLDAILNEVDGLMVARGDLGVEMRPEKVPMTQKRIIRACNARGLPVITATQMLESMINEVRPTRAEASDVANAILDGTDCVMLSGETAIGKFPVQAVRMMHRIALEVEPSAEFPNHPRPASDETSALSDAIATIDRRLDLRCIVAFTSGGYSARLVSSRRPRAPVIALTPDQRVFHSLNLLWGVRPIIVPQRAGNLQEVLAITEKVLREKKLAAARDRILVVAGLPMGKSGGTNVVKVHRID
jgi:pyruvate kinase